MVHEVIQRAKSVLLVLVIKGSMIESSRGAGLLRLLTSVMRLMTDKGIEDDCFVLPVVNNPHTYKSVKFLEGALVRI